MLKNKYQILQAVVFLFVWINPLIMSFAMTESCYKALAILPLRDRLTISAIPRQPVSSPVFLSEKSLGIALDPPIKRVRKHITNICHSTTFRYDRDISKIGIQGAISDNHLMEENINRHITKTNWSRLALISGGGIGLSIFAFQRFNTYFGGVAQPFSIGSDWHKDHALHVDELLHFQGNYRIAQGLTHLFHWVGFDSKTSEIAGISSTAAIMTLLEYTDGRRPNDEASYSDLIANLLGLTFAYAKSDMEALRDFDVKFSYSHPLDFMRSETLLDYNRMTHWLTYDLKSKTKLPVHVGLGYGVQNAFSTEVRSELYLGVGITASDLIHLYFPQSRGWLSWLNMYFFSLHFKIS